MRLRVIVIALAFGVSSPVAVRVTADDAERLLTIDHFVGVKSTVPAMTGQPAQLYVRERAKAGVMARGRAAGDRVVLFVHGAGTPAEVAFDVPYQDYSWMGYLANADFDVFSVDMTGYGRSTRPTPMNDPCNLAETAQRTFIPRLLAAPCPATYTQAITTIASDWDDVSAAVEYVRSLRRVDKVSLVAWSQGGPRSGGYTAQHADRVNRLVLLAPAYNRTGPDAPSARAPQAVPFNTQSHDEFVANWDRQVGCRDQYEQAVSDSVWSQMLASDPVGATWGTGVRRAPNTPTWGWNNAIVAKTRTPVLMFTGVHDKQVAPDRVRELYMDVGSTEKVFVDLACSSHNAMWERNHLLMFRASLEWLEKGTVNGMKQGMLRLGYESHEGK
jgi:pimeloyl-ACP methyl ester carboxylesterase